MRLDTTQKCAYTINRMLEYPNMHEDNACSSGTSLGSTEPSRDSYVKYPTHISAEQFPVTGLAGKHTQVLTG